MRFFQKRLKFKPLPPSPGIADFQALLALENRRRFRMIETACEKALLSGVDGVLVVYSAWGSILSAEPDPRVPYGHVWHIPEAGLAHLDA